MLRGGCGRHCSFVGQTAGATDWPRALLRGRYMLALATKDLRFGMGMGAMHVKSPERRDRLWLINAFAVVLLTLLGAAGEALGYDRMLKTNTAKRRVHSLFRQGCMLYDLIPTMPEARLRPLMQRFSLMLQEQPLFADVFGPV